MLEIWKSLRVYLLLLAYLVIVKLLMPVVQPRFPVLDQEAQFTWVFLVVLAAVGGLGTVLYVKSGFPPMWESTCSIRKRVLIPFAVGAAFGVVMVILDITLKAGSVAARNLRISSIHMPLPESLLLYPAAAIIVETLLRLIPISLAVWLISEVLLRGRSHAIVFWVSAAVTAAVEPFQQAPLFHGAPVLVALSLVYAYLFNLVQMYFFRVEGLLGAFSQRLGNYAIWHIIWGGALAARAA